MPAIGIPFSGLPEEFARLLLDGVVGTFGGDFDDLWLGWEAGYLSEEHMDQVYQIATARGMLDELESYLIA